MDMLGGKKHLRSEAMKDLVLSELRRSIEQGKAVALCTVTRTRGSTPRKAGAKMLVRADGQFTGTIGGGCGEAEVLEAAMEVVQSGQPRIVEVDLTNDLDGDDRICGGIMRVFVEPIAPEN